MSKSELEQMIMEETKGLSTETLKEVLDFIQFIKTKKYVRQKTFHKKVTRELTGLNQTSLAHLEEEFADYKAKYPHEG